MENIQTTLQTNSEKVNFTEVDHNLENLMPTATEICHLWSSYMAECMSVAFLKHMVAKSKDPAFHKVLQFALNTSSQRVDSMENLFKVILHPIPYGFGEEDVDINAPQLFSEEFCVMYTRFTSKYILINYGFAFSDCTRSDFRQLFSGFIDGTKAVIATADNVLIAKGLLTKQPNIPVPKKTVFINNKGYYGSIFGANRPINAIEISNIFNITTFKRNMRALKLGFAQVVKSEKIRDYLIKGLHMADKQLDILVSFLHKEDLPGPEILDFRVTDSIDSPYSDRLMLYHVTVMIGYIAQSYGHGITNTARQDIGSAFTRLMIEIMKYTKDGVEILIENNWFEQIPQAADRQELTH